MEYVLQSSGIIRKSGALIVRYSQKKKWVSFVFYCFEYPSIAHNFGTTGPIQVGFSTKCTSPYEQFNQIEIWKCDMFDVRMISPDRITYVGSYKWVRVVSFFAVCTRAVFCFSCESDDNVIRWTTTPVKGWVDTPMWDMHRLEDWIGLQQMNRQDLKWVA